MRQVDELRAEILELRRKIKIKKEEADAIRLTNITPNYERLPVQTSGTSDKVGNAGVKAAEISMIIEEYEKRLDECTEEMVGIIETLPDCVGKSVLLLRYVHGVSWGKIKRSLHYSEAHIYRAHREALEKLRR